MRVWLRIALLALRNRKHLQMIGAGSDVDLVIASRISLTVLTEIAVIFSWGGQEVFFPSASSLTHYSLLITHSSFLIPHSSFKRRYCPMLRVLSLLAFALSIFFTCECADTIGCWANSPDSKLSPTTFRECRHLIKWMNSFDKDKGEITFSRKPGVGYRLPDQWMLGTCVLGIDMVSDDVEDTVTFREIGIEAYTVALACVIRPPHLGGRRPVGPKGLINVTLWGTKGTPGRPRPLLGPRLNETYPSEETLLLREGSPEERGRGRPIFDLDGRRGAIPED